MDNNNQVSDTAQGVDPVVADEKAIQKWLVEDVRRCIALLTAINQDVDLQRVMAQWFHGRIQNYKNKPDPNQGILFDKR